MALSRKQILDTSNEEYAELNVPEWAGTVRLRALKACERDRFEADSFQGRGEDAQVNLVNMRARLVAMCLVDDHGKRLFTNDEAEALGDKLARPMNRIFTKCQQMNGMTKEDIDFFAKSSSMTTGSSSSSSSPSPSAAPAGNSSNASTPGS